MRRTFCLLGILTFVVTNPAIAQQSTSLPAIVQQRIDGDTVLVARIDLTEPGLSTISKFLSELPDPSGSFGKRAVDCDRAMQKLLALKVKEVFAITSSDNLPANGATIVIPSSGIEAERTAIANALKSIWPENVELSTDGVVVGESGSRQIPHIAKPTIRPEFAAAFALVKEGQVQIVVALGTDTRRVLRELLPAIPQEFGGGPIGPVADSWQWLALGVTPSPKLDLQLIVQAKDTPSAEALERIVVSVLKSAAESESVKSVLPKARGLVAVLTPSRKNDRLVVSLNEANGGAKRLMDEVASPLLVQMEKDARRMKTINNLKQVMLAMHYYHDKHRALPPQAARSADGKKLLSWRVLILPFLGEEALYNEFHLDEPWDSEHNLKLVTRMPDVFASSGVLRDQRAKGMTTYLAPIAEKTLFASPDGIPFRKITDGTSNTIAIVEANADRAVPWTKPADLEVDLKQPLKGLTGQDGGRFRAGMCDGSIRGISDTMDIETIRRLFQFNDGEVVGDF